MPVRSWHCCISGIWSALTLYATFLYIYQFECEGCSYTDSQFYLFLYNKYKFYGMYIISFSLLSATEDRVATPAFGFRQCH